MTDRIAVLRALQQRYDACHALCGDDMQMLLPCIDGLADELWPHLPALLDCAEALAEAITEIDDWAAYAAPVFREKHDLEGTLSRFRAALADGEASNGS